MECLLLSFFTMLTGVVFISLVKTEYKFKIFSLFALISVGMFSAPMFFPVETGSSLKLPTKYSLLFEQLNIVLDPYSAFVGLLLALLFIFYLYKLFTDKTYRQNFHSPIVVLLALFSAAFAISTQNALYFIVVFWILTSITAILSNKYSADESVANKKFLLISFFSLLIFLAVVLLCVYSQNFNYDMMTNVLENKIGLANTLFCLIFTGFGIPYLLSDSIIVDYKSEAAIQHSELFILKVMLSVFYFYCLLRYAVMGVVPLPFYYLVVLSGLSVYAIIRLYKLIMAKNITNTLVNINSIQDIIVIFSVLAGICGYICNVPLVSIFGFSAAFLFFINKFLLLYSADLHNKANIMPIGILSCAGFPLTIGFWGMCFILGAVCTGIFSANMFLKICSYVIAILFLCIILVQVYKVFLIVREYSTKQENKNGLYDYKNFNVLFDVLILLAGLFPLKILKLIFVPVSMFVGGTKFYDVFNAIEGLAHQINLYIWIFAGLIIAYVVIKLLVKMIKRYYMKG